MIKCQFGCVFNATSLQVVQIIQNIMLEVKLRVQNIDSKLKKTFS